MLRKTSVRRRFWRVLSVLISVSMIASAIPPSTFAASLPPPPTAEGHRISGGDPEATSNDRQASAATLDTAHASPDSSELVEAAIIAPEDGALVNSPTVVVTGDIHGADDVASIVVNGVTAMVSNGAFSATVPVEPGNQAVHVVTTDLQGRVSIVSRVLAVDREGPVLTVHSPRDRQSVYTLRPTIAISYTDFYTNVAPATLQVDLARTGQPAVDVTSYLSVDSQGAIGAVGFDLSQDAVYTLTASVNDALGNAGAITTTFYVPTNPSSIVPPVEPENAGWVSGVVYDSSTCDQNLTQCQGLKGARITLVSVSPHVVYLPIITKQAPGASTATAPDSQFSAVAPPHLLKTRTRLDQLQLVSSAPITETVPGTVVSGPDGFFAFPVAETGVYWLRVEKDGYTYSQREAVVALDRSTATNAIYLTRLDPAVTPCDAAGCSHTSSDGLIRVDIPAGAIPPGQSVDVTATSFEQMEFLPSGGLPDGTWETYAFNLGGDSEYRFQEGFTATVRVSNTLGFSPGTRIPLGYWNQTTQAWEHAGVGAVDPTGKWVVMGVTHFSNYDCNDPISNQTAKPEGGDGTKEDDPKTCPAGQGKCFISAKSGVLQEWMDLPAVSLLGRSIAPQLRYSTDHANPSEVIDVKLSMSDAGAEIRNYVGWELYIEGEKTSSFSFSANLLVDAEVGRYRYFWDGRDALRERLPTGVYEYAVRLSIPYRAEYCYALGGIFGNPPDCVYGRTGRYVEAFDELWVNGTVAVANETASPFGAGWVLDGVQRLYESEAGYILITDGQSSDEFYVSASGFISSSTATDYSILTHNAASGAYSRLYPNGVKVYFRPDGRHDYTLDPNGYRTVYTYNADGTLATMGIARPGASSPGWTWTFNYTAGRLSSISDPAGRVTYFTIDGQGNLVEVATPDAAIRRFAYNPQHLLTHQTDQNGAVTTYTYDAYGRIIADTEPPRPVYNPITGGTIVAQDVITFTTSDTGYPLINSSPVGDPASPAPPVPTSAGLIDRIEYGGSARTGHTNEWGSWLDETDGEGRTTRYRRDVSNNITRVDYPDNTCAEYAYDARGNLLVEERMGAIQCALQPASRDPAQVQRWAYTYEPVFNQVATIRDPNGSVTAIHYDARGNPTEIIDASGTRTLVQYEDANCPGQPTRVTNAVGLPEQSTTTFQYDSTSCRLTRTTDPLGNATTLAYDAAGNVLQTIDAEGRVTRFRYDAMNRLVKVIDATNSAPNPACGQAGVTCYTYDDLGNLMQVQDARGSSTSFEYDPLNRVIRSIDPAGAAERFSYDARGNLRFSHDRNGSIIEFRYDLADQLKDKIWNSGDPAREITTTYSYDPMGRLRSAEDPDSTLSFRYDPFGRLSLASTGLLADPQAVVGPYAGAHSDVGSLGLTVSEDGLYVEAIQVNNYYCGSNRTFVVTPPFPGIPIVDGRFTATDLSTGLGAGRTVDVDGVFFDADGDALGAREQALGGIQFQDSAARCHFSWAARATLVTSDTDGDGWSNAAESLLGSSATTFSYTPEHISIPTTQLLGPAPCFDGTNNDGPSSTTDIDAADPGCAGTPRPLPPPPEPRQFEGNHSDSGNVLLTLSTDGQYVTQVQVSDLYCNSTNNSFSITPAAPGIPVSGGRFSASDLSTSLGGDRAVDIDGALWDADGFASTAEQAIGGLQFRSGYKRCHVSWAATTIVDNDKDGYNDAAERLMHGSDTIGYAPEHISVPATQLLGPAPCFDGANNDGSSSTTGIDADDPGCVGTPRPLPPPPEPRQFEGNHSDSGNVLLTLSTDGQYVTQVQVSDLYCGSNRTFTITTTVPITDNFFSAVNLPTGLGGGETIDLDGAFFDADGFASTREQVLGGIVFRSGATACPETWVATTIVDNDKDGWNDAAERLLRGSDSTSGSPEHASVPTTPLYGPSVCRDGRDNDGDGLIDTSDPGCVGAGGSTRPGQRLSFDIRPVLAQSGVDISFGSIIDIAWKPAQAPIAEAIQPAIGVAARTLYLPMPKVKSPDVPHVAALRLLPVLLSQGKDRLPEAHVATPRLKAPPASFPAQSTPVQPAVTIRYKYDEVGNRIAMVWPTATITYSYDALNRLASMRSPFSQTITFSYDALSRRTGLALPNGVSTSYSYDKTSQLLSLVNSLGASTISSFSYTYDKVGNRTSMSQQRSALTVNPSLNYGYDALYRLTQATHPLPANPLETFQYDPVGNRLLRDGQTQPAQFDAANRLLQDQQFCYGYDANGNQISKEAKVGGVCSGTGERTEYVYDPENQLIEVRVNGALVASYRYDGLGRRIEKNVGGQITRYVYDNEDILLEYNGANALVARYTHGPGIDEPLVMERDLNADTTFETGERFFYHTDGLGSITDLTGPTGTVSQAYGYDSFGNIISAKCGAQTFTGVEAVRTALGNPAVCVPNPYTYTGREFDPESGLYYYRARYYDTQMGRFTAADPLGFAAGVNSYTYVNNNPINYTDPTGLQPLCLNVGDDDCPECVDIGCDAEAKESGALFGECTGEECTCTFYVLGLPSDPVRGPVPTPLPPLLPRGFPTDRKIDRVPIFLAPNR